MMSKQPAFTIIEMLVAMIVASVLLTLVWTVVFFSGNYKSRIMSKSEMLREMKRAEYYLMNDFQMSETTNLQGSRLSIFLKQDTIRYDFDQKQLIRHSGGTADTLAIAGVIVPLTREAFQVCFVLQHYCFSLSKHNAGDLLLNRTAK